MQDVFRPRSINTSSLPALCWIKRCMNSRAPGKRFCQDCIDRARELDLAQIRSGRKSPDGFTWIYFIAALDAGLVKIGRAKNVISRYQALQGSGPSKLELLAAFLGRPDVESKLHAEFAAHRRHGEWFVQCREIMEFVEGVSRGQTPEWLTGTCRNRKGELHILVDWACALDKTDISWSKNDTDVTH